MQEMFLIYFKISALEKGFLKEMEVISIKHILSWEEFPIVLIRLYEIDPFIMGYHVYKTNWSPVVEEKLTGVMEPNNLMDKYAVAVRSYESIFHWENLENLQRHRKHGNLLS